MNNIIDILTSQDNVLLSDKIHMIDKYIYMLLNAALKPYDLTFNQAIVIMYVYSAKNNIYQKDIENLLGLTNPSVTNLIKNLMKKDFIYRIQDESDGRYFHLHCTPKSEKIVEEVGNAIANVNEKFNNELDKEDLQTLNTILDKLLVNIHKNIK